MAKYIGIRLLALIPLLLAVAVVAFSISVAMEARGSIATQILGEGATPEAVAEIESSLGLDDPVPLRFGRWISDAARGDFGNSLRQQNVTVTSLIGERIWPTLSIVTLSLIIGVAFGLAFGIVGGMKPGGWADRILTVISASLIAMPGFLVAMLLVYFVAVKLEWLDPTGYTPPSEGIGAWLKSILLPALALALPTVALVQRQLRSSMTNVLQTRYVLAARARGIPRASLIRHHVLRNAMIPTVTVIGFRAAAALGLTFAVEQVFAIRGMGGLITEAIVQRNVPVVQGCLMVVAVIVLLVNLLVDICYAYLNPKVRLQ